MTVYNNAKYTKHQMCMHGHGHVSCELLMSIFERNVLERERERERETVVFIAQSSIREDEAAVAAAQC